MVPRDAIATKTALPSCGCAAPSSFQAISKGSSPGLATNLTMIARPALVIAATLTTSPRARNLIASEGAPIDEPVCERPRDLARMVVHAPKSE